MSQQSKFKNFPDWKYGYTLGPPSVNNGGDYTVLENPSIKTTQATEERISPSNDKEDPNGNKDSETSTSNYSTTPCDKNYINIDDPKDKLKKEHDTKESTKQHHYEIALDKAVQNSMKKELEQEVPLEEILKGRNPIMYCNEQSKVIKRTISFEPVSESGPPHDKTFVFRGVMEGTFETNGISKDNNGDNEKCLQTIGTDKTKKGAKTKAAEEMVKHIHKLITNVKSARKRTWWDSEYNRTLNQTLNPVKTAEKFNFYKECDTKLVQPNSCIDKLVEKDVEAETIKRQKIVDATENVESKTDQIINKSVGFSPQANNSPQNNPISKLYEHCKKLNISDPLFELSSENVIEQKRTYNGSHFKKSEYTMKCDVFGKSFYGKAFSKKEAKKLAAADAWNDLLAANKVQADEKSNIGYSQGLTISEMIAQVKSQHPIKNEIISSE